MKRGRHQGLNPCPCRKLDPNILMVQSAKNWCGQNASDDLNCPRKLNPNVLTVQSAKNWCGQNASDDPNSSRYRRVLAKR